MRIRKPHIYTFLMTAVLVGGFFLLGDTALAQVDVGLGTDVGLSNQDIRVTIANIIRVILGFLGIVAVIMMMYGGAQWMFASGREDAIQKAQRTIINATIGLVIILSALAITQFVLNTLVGATSGSNISDSGSSTYSPPNGTFGQGFSLRSVSPTGTLSVRNVIVQAGFSSNVDPSTVSDNFVVRRVDSNTPEPGVASVSGSVITFTPSTPCPNPNSTETCFDYDTSAERGVTYAIEISGGLRGTNGQALSTCFAGCGGTFTTGALVDVTPPVVVITYPNAGASVSVNPNLTVSVHVTDDSGVGIVEGMVDGVIFGTDSPTPTSADFVAEIPWIDSGLIAQSRYVIDALGIDITGRMTSASDITVIARPDSCFDTEINNGETGLNCGGDSTSLNYCGACESDSCTSDAECSAGLSCVSGTCAQLPTIISVSPTNGSPGNFITITGINLGNATGTVRFLGDPEIATDDLVAGLACSNSWSADEVIVAIPDPVTVSSTTETYPIGPIEIEIFNGQTDRTDDLNGSYVSDFEINNTQRPGLCSVSPVQGSSGDVVSLSGARLGNGADSAVFFSGVSATSTSNWSDSGLSVTVPQLSLDPFLKNITVQRGSESSNPVSFGIDPLNLGPVPTIQFIDTESAPMGQIVTIFGANFGFQEGNVVFDNPDAYPGKVAYGSDDFPDTCSAGTWTPSSITIIVPNAFTPPDPTEPFIPGLYNVHIERTDGSESAPVGFTVDSGLPGPGICRVTPVTGPVNTVVDIYGTNFGAASDTVSFTGGDSVNVALWEDEHITATAPLTASTGPMLVTVNGVNSNEVPFEVGSCTVSPDSCQANTRCCSNSLSCELITNGSECDADIPTPTNYLFEWVTGPIPVFPRVIARCDGTATTLGRVVSPSPWDGRPGGEVVCTNAKIAATFTVDVIGLNSNTVLVNKCLDADCVSADPIEGNLIVQSDRFQFVPNDPLGISTKYEVTITTGVTAAGEGGESMDSDYVWTFTTKNSSTPCLVEGVDVLPGEETLTEVGDGDPTNSDSGDVALVAAPYGEDACVYLTSNEPLVWSTANNTSIPGPLALNLSDGDSNTEQVATALGESISSAVSVFATFINQQISGFSLIRVDFTDPVVRNYWPTCDEACTNAQIGAQFNTQMSDASLSSASVRLLRCYNELCDGGTSVNIDVPALSVDGFEQVIELASGTNFVPGDFYRVIIDDSVMSASGVSLTGLNYGNSFSWKFRVSPTGALCTIDRVEVEPRFTTLYAIGDRQQFTATPFGPADDCSEGGQRLNRSSYGWNWQSSNTDTAFLISGGALDLGGSAQCNGSCLLNGSAPGISVCGNELVELGEECDYKSCSDNSVCSTDSECIGIGDGSCEVRAGDGCSETCLWEGTDACSVSACDLSDTACTDDLDCQYGTSNTCDLASSTCTITENSCTSDAQCLSNGGRCRLVGNNCCGNGSLDNFEDCDDGYLLNGDGCSDTCQNEGSSAAGSVCGNNDVASSNTFGGEECDFGDNIGGDGCSPQCLWEGSRSDSPSVCGNGLPLEPGEECDDGNTENGDGCTSQCLFDGGVACPTGGGPNCCGNGIQDPGNFEQCDSGDGCSSSCLLEGSSIYYGTASFCGDGNVGPGESSVCEGVSGDLSVDGIQFAEVSASLASQPASPNGIFSTLITGEVDIVPPKSDDAELNVSCSCQASIECPTSGVSFACGAASGCCAPRPDPPGFIPTGEDNCRNAEVKVTFVGLMDPDSLFEPDIDTGSDIIAGSANVLLYNTSVGSSAACDAISGHVYVASNNVNVTFLPQFANNWISSFLDWMRPNARAITPGCYMEATPVSNDVLGNTEVVLQYNGVLAPNSVYNIVVMGDSAPLDGNEIGITSITGAGYSATQPSGSAFVSTFTTGSEVCKLDKLSVVDQTGNGYYATANESHNFKATALSRRGSGYVAIQPISAYSWDNVWSVPTDSTILALAGDQVGVNEAVQSLEENGTEYVSAIATISQDTFFQPTTVGRQVSSSEEALVFICEMPWPNDTTIAGHLEAPLQDTAGNANGIGPTASGRYTNFSTMYCRAETAPSTVTSRLGINVAQAQTGVLPDFSIVEPPVTLSSNVVREILLKHPDKAEAIGIRAVDNAGSLALSQWYAQEGFTGSPEAMELDGFSALRDGRTIYANASNIDINGDIEQLIYAISYSEGASPDTIDVYNQLINTWSFNAGSESPYVVSNLQICTNSAGETMERPEGGFYQCSADIDCISQTQDLGALCDADVDKIRRDIKRVEDFRAIENVVSNYGDTNRHCSATTNLVCIEDDNCPTGETCEAGVPLLDAGTFIRGWSTSAWPSWSAELGNELASGLPVDPVNKFAQCPPKVCSNSPGTSCIVDNDCPNAADGETCEATGSFDSDTCWDGNASLFQCPAGSHVYRYQRTGIEDYTLAVDLETSPSDFEWVNKLNPLTGNVTLSFGRYASAGATANALTCDGLTNYGASAVCGDGVIGAFEVCEIGQTSSETCSIVIDGVVNDGAQVTTCNSTCTAFVAQTSACVPFSCGNGVVEGRCASATNPVACLSNDVCGAIDGIPIECDFNAATAEVCDDGALNGTYGFCGTQCNYLSGSTLICGNGVIEGPETCDDGILNGTYSQGGGGCSWNCTGPPPRCGDGLVNGAEQCDTEFETSVGPFEGTTATCTQEGFCVGGLDAGDSCLTSATCQVDPLDGLATACVQFDTFRSRSCDPATCTWDSWGSCSQQGTCGNGVEDAGEQCDDGNDSNTDGCTNICQINVCGDGFLDPTYESCDLGGNNGEECTPGYGGTCNYCTTSCSYQTVSGGYCGDGAVQPAGGELCDGSPPTNWYVAFVDSEYSQSDIGTVLGSCTLNPNGSLTGGDTNGDTISESICDYTGACNGGSDNGQSCVPALNAILPCADGAACAPRVCDAGCGSSCPFNYQSMYIQATEDDVVGANPSDDVTLYSSSSAGTCSSSLLEYDGILCHSDGMCGPSAPAGSCEYVTIPDSATINVPECSVASSLQADVTYNYTYRPLDVVFVLDFASAMDQPFPNALLGPTRRDVMEDALQANIERLYDEYPGPVRVGFVKMTNGNMLDRVEDSNSSAWPAWQDIAAPANLIGVYDSVWGSADCVSEPYKVTGEDRYDYNLPEDWQDIVGNGDGSTGTHENSAACILLWPDDNDTGAVDSFLNQTMPSILSGGWNANSAAMNRAMYMLQQFPADHERVIVHMTNGIPRCVHNQVNGSGVNTSPWTSNDADCELVINRLHRYSESIKNQGMKVYTATLMDATNDVITREFELISSDCPARNFAGVAETADDLAGLGYYSPLPGAAVTMESYFGTPSNAPGLNETGVYGLSRYGNSRCISPPKYSYVGDSQGSLVSMFDSIIDNIVGTSVTLTDTTTESTATVIPGVGVSMPLPPGFVCDTTTDQEVEISTDFSGDGTVTIGNFRFLHCSE